MLLHYFGEDKSEYCGCCDYCLSKNEKGIGKSEFSRIRDAVLLLLKESPCPVFEILPRFRNENEEHVLSILRWMQDQGEILMDGGGYWRLREN
jgi:ATP-dependent DNA helicase RecQ